MINNKSDFFKKVLATAAVVGTLTTGAMEAVAVAVVDVTRSDTLDVLAGGAWVNDSNLIYRPGGPWNAAASTKAGGDIKIGVIDTNGQVQSILGLAMQNVTVASITDTSAKHEGSIILGIPPGGGNLTVTGDIKNIASLVVDVRNGGGNISLDGVIEVPGEIFIKSEGNGLNLSGNIASTAVGNIRILASGLGAAALVAPHITLTTEVGNIQVESGGNADVAFGDVAASVAGNIYLVGSNQNHLTKFGDVTTRWGDVVIQGGTHGAITVGNIASESDGFGGGGVSGGVVRAIGAAGGLVTIGNVAADVRVIADATEGNIEFGDIVAPTVEVTNATKGVLFGDIKGPDDKAGNATKTELRVGAGGGVGINTLLGNLTFTGDGTVSVTDGTIGNINTTGDGEGTIVTDDNNMTLGNTTGTKTIKSINVNQSGGHILTLKSIKTQNLNFITEDAEVHIEAGSKPQVGIINFAGGAGGAVIKVEDNDDSTLTYSSFINVVAGDKIVFDGTGALEQKGDAGVTILPLIELTGGVDKLVVFSGKINVTDIQTAAVVEGGIVFTNAIISGGVNVGGGVGASNITLRNSTIGSIGNNNPANIVNVGNGRSKVSDIHAEKIAFVADGELTIVNDNQINNIAQPIVSAVNNTGTLIIEGNGTLVGNIGGVTALKEVEVNGVLDFGAFMIRATNVTGGGTLNLTNADAHVIGTIGESVADRFTGTVQLHNYNMGDVLRTPNLTKAIYADTVTIGDGGTVTSVGRVNAVTILLGDNSTFNSSLAPVAAAGYISDGDNFRDINLSNAANVGKVNFIGGGEIPGNIDLGLTPGSEINFDNGVGIRMGPVPLGYLFNGNTLRAATITTTNSIVTIAAQTVTGNLVMKGATTINAATDGTQAHSSHMTVTGTTAFDNDGVGTEQSLQVNVQLAGVAVAGYNINLIESTGALAGLAAGQLRAVAINPFARDDLAASHDADWRNLGIRTVTQAVSNIVSITPNVDGNNVILTVIYNPPAAAAIVAEAGAPPQLAKVPTPEAGALLLQLEAHEGNQEQQAQDLELAGLKPVAAQETLSTTVATQEMMHAVSANMNTRMASMMPSMPMSGSSSVAPSAHPEPVFSGSLRAPDSGSFGESRGSAAAAHSHDSGAGKGSSSANKAKPSSSGNSKPNKSKDEGVSGGDIAENLGVWINGFGGAAIQKRKSGNSGYKSKLYGGSIGLDTALDEQLIIGAAFTKADANVSYKDIRRGNTTKSDMWMFSLYGMYDFGNNFFARSIASCGSSKVTSKERRDLNLFAGTYATATSKYRSKAGSIEVSGGYRYALKDDVVLTPLAGLQYAAYRDGGYTDKGDVSFQNTVAKKSYNQLIGILGTGINSYYRFDEDTLIIPEAHAYINQVLSSKNAKARVKTSILPDTTMVATQKPTKTTWSLGAGATIKSGMAEFGLDYDATISKKYLGHQGSVKLRINF